MSDKRQQMQGFLSRANAVMARVEQISPKVPSKGQPTMSESARMDGLSLGPDYDDGYQQQNYQQQNYQQQNYQQQGYEQGYSQQNGGYSPAAKNLPSGIMESFQQNPIEEYQGQMGGLSVLDGIMPQQQRQQPQQQRQQPRQQINEDYGYGEKQMPTTEELLRNRRPAQQDYQPAYQPQQVVGGQIDYSMISTLIKAAISEEMLKLRKTILNESKQASGASDSVIVKLGSDIQFITKTGDIFRGNLVKVGNVKDQ